MATESEIKYKLAGSSDWRRLTGPGGLGTPLGAERQENIYLDTADLRLAGSLVMLRIRRRGGEGAPLLTWKSGTEVEAGFFRSTEVEAEIPPGKQAEVLAQPSLLYRLDLPPVAELRARFGEVPLLVQGSLATERARFQGDGFVVEVDRMSFPDGSEECEVEVETERPEEARAWLLREFRRVGVRAEPSSETKYARLLSWLSAHRV
jgi:uncharacterized protein YjbK